MAASPTPSDPVVIVGSGLAGLSLAMRLAGELPVVVVTKGPLRVGSTGYAQGGIAVAIDPSDTVDDHVADTLAAGAGLCDPEAVELICGDGPARLADLVAIGVAFDRIGGDLELAREGAHGQARVAHAGGDATGAHIMRALERAVRSDARIVTIEGHAATDIIVRDGEVVGVRLRARPDGAMSAIGARAVVLATGGMGQLFSRTTNPLVATADGPALAHRAGALVGDLEFVQFHPTALALGSGPLALVTEATRGAGAVLRDRHGRRFMRDVHPLAELGPRDVVARAIATRAAEDGADVTLDLSHLDPESVLAHFPTVATACRAHGLDLTRDRIPVTPAAHYAMGGVMTDASGRSTLPGLWAIGEAACTGMHGANRLASNSLLEAVVMAGRAADVLVEASAVWPDAPTAAPRPAHPRARDDRRAVQAAVWAGAGVVREEDGLRLAASVLSSARDGDDFETGNIVDIALLAVRAAGLREESRGAHARSDYPSVDDAFAHRIAWCGEAPLEMPVHRMSTTIRGRP